MLASLIDAPLDDPDLVYEPKYDGIRAIADVPGMAGRGRTGVTGHVRLWSRLGNEKTNQFPEIVDVLGRWARKLSAPVVLDGEIVALDENGQPTGFQQLQGRIHVLEPQSAATSGEKGSTVPRVAFIAFDLLRDGSTDLRERPLLERRAALERLFSKTGSPVLRLSEMVRGDGRALYKRALESGWEGLIAKHAQSLYKSGKRSPDWRKLKIVHEQEFVVGGWTEPRQTRTYFGALLLGVYAKRAGSRKARGGDQSALVYAGHTGTGFNERELGRLMKLLRPLARKDSPFEETPKTNERPHWVEPRLVVQIKFTEWTADNKLRHPVYLGMRDDKKAQDVVREDGSRLHSTSSARIVDHRDRKKPAPTTRSRPAALKSTQAATDRLVEQLRVLEDSRRDGIIELPDGDRLAVTNLHKVFWPKQRLTKGDLFRYYAQVAPFILPAVADRPLVMKRFPNGIQGKPFYQHRIDDVPEGVRVELVVGSERTLDESRRGRGTHSTAHGEERRPQLVGGTLNTLLYMTQLASISQDPWFSRAQSPGSVDHVALDLDPMPGVGFDRVIDIARWIGDELESLGMTGVPKTSGADGLHIYIPMPPGTPYEAGRLFCQIVATVVAQKHPRQASVERTVALRGKRVYVDYLQNILGKTLATAYSARANDRAGVSTPLTWKEVQDGVRREDFTITTVLDRLRRVGDLWAALREAKGVDLGRVEKYVGKDLQVRK